MTLTAGEIRCLTKIIEMSIEGPAPVVNLVELGEALGVSRVAARKAVGRLVKKGYAIRAWQSGPVVATKMPDGLPLRFSLTYDLGGLSANEEELAAHVNSWAHVLVRLQALSDETRKARANVELRRRRPGESTPSRSQLRDRSPVRRYLDSYLVSLEEEGGDPDGDS